jgi:hypothetical protein
MSFEQGIVHNSRNGRKGRRVTDRCQGQNGAIPLAHKDYNSINYC